MSLRSTLSLNQLTHSPATEKAVDDEISKVHPDPVLTVDDVSGTAPIFDAFKDVDLDLAFTFSTQNSPSSSTAELPLSEFASPVLPPPICLPSSSTSAEAPSSYHSLPRTMSLASQLRPLSPLKKKLKSTTFSDQSSILRGSWPAIKYVGRGTPANRSRRKEWSGLSAENVGEDGLLFSDARATSLDSRSPRISTSSEWDFLNSGIPTSGSSFRGGGSISIHQQIEEENEIQEDRIPPLQKIDIKLEHETEDWASVMETVLSSAEKAEKQRGDSSAAVAAVTGTVLDFRQTEVTGNMAADITEELPPEVVDRLKSELQFDVNIDKALDLGFTPVVGGGNFFTLSAITDSDNSNLTIRRTTTNSTHSQYSTPSEGPSDDRPTAFSTPGSAPPVQESAKIFSDIKSTISSKALPHLGLKMSLKTGEGMPWWKKVLGRLKRAQMLLRPHRNTC